MNARKEPNAEQRQAAAEIFGTFNALVLEGFSEDQALRIVGYMLGQGGGS